MIGQWKDGIRRADDTHGGVRHRIGRSFEPAVAKDDVVGAEKQVGVVGRAIGGIDARSVGGRPVVDDPLRAGALHRFDGGRVIHLDHEAERERAGRTGSQVVK